MAFTAFADRRAAASRMPMGLPAGRRVSRGNLRWYLANVPEGREQALCDNVIKLIDPSVLADAFVPRKERWFKRRGSWSLQQVVMYPGYLFIATADVRALDQALAKLTLPVQIVGSDTHAWTPLAPEAQAWFEASMDADHVIRSSMAQIIDGSLHVQSGPLAGQEGHLFKVDRHQRRCLLHVGEGEGSFTTSMAIVVPQKT